MSCNNKEIKMFIADSNVHAKYYLSQKILKLFFWESNPKCRRYSASPIPQIYLLYLLYGPHRHCILQRDPIYSVCNILTYYIYIIE